MDKVSLMAPESVVEMNNQTAGSADWDGRDPEFNPFISYFEVDSAFHSMVNLELKEGRWQNPNSEEDRKNAVLNETAVKEFNLPQPVIGQRFSSRGDTGIVIGVVKDFYYRSLHEKIGPAVIKLNEYGNYTFLVRTSPGNAVAGLQAAEKIWKANLPNEPFSASFVDDEFERLYSADKKTSVLVWVFSGIAVFISCLGLFGLAAFTAERRWKEIGIRKVLGATVPNIITLISREFVVLILIAIVIATPIAWIVTSKWLENYAYRIDVSWWIFVIAGLLTIVISLITLSFQAIRAAMDNPVKSLRTE